MLLICYGISHKYNYIFSTIEYTSSLPLKKLELKFANDSSNGKSLNHRKKMHCYEYHTNQPPYLGGSNYDALPLCTVTGEGCKM